MPKDYSTALFGGRFFFSIHRPPCPSFFVLHRHGIAPSWLKIEGLYRSKNLLRGVIYVADRTMGTGRGWCFLKSKLLQTRRHGVI